MSERQGVESGGEWLWWTSVEVVAFSRGPRNRVCRACVQSAAQASQGSSADRWGCLAHLGSLCRCEAAGLMLNLASQGGTCSTRLGSALSRGQHRRRWPGRQ